jgi:cytochrome c oxidase subunit II
MSAEKNTIHIDSLERNWLIMSAVMLVIFATVLFISAFGSGIQVPVPFQRVDPNTVATDPNSPWSDPGLREIVPGKKYEVYIVATARTWKFTPNEIKVPVGATVTFYVVSVDVQHGFKIQNTNVNAQIVPGHVTKMTTTFKEAGTYVFMCTEYCGSAHAQMSGSVIVGP